jgi:hypothetical protein
LNLLRVVVLLLCEWIVLFLKGELSHSFKADVDFPALGAGKVWSETTNAVVTSYKPSEVFLALSVTEEGSVEKQN